MKLWCVCVHVLKVYEKIVEQKSEMLINQLVSDSDQIPYHILCNFVHTLTRSHVIFRMLYTLIHKSCYTPE